MTNAEFQLVARIDTRLARMEEQLANHCKQHERDEGRSRARAPWVAIAIAAASWVVSIAALLVKL